MTHPCPTLGCSDLRGRQRMLGDFDGRIGDGILERLEQQARFPAAPTAIFHDVGSRPDGIRDLIGACCQKGQLGPCHVVLGLSCNQLEQYRAAMVVEVLGGQPPGALRKASEHIAQDRSEEHTSELQSLMRISYAVFCLKKKTR